MKVTLIVKKKMNRRNSCTAILLNKFVYFDMKSYMNRSMKQCQVYVSLILHVTMFIC